MAWTLEYNGSTGTFASFGVSNVTRIRKNLLTDRVTFHVRGDSLLSPPTFAANSTVKIFNGESKWFEGIVTQTPLHCSAEEEGYAYEVAGMWWYLENIIYQQAWKEPIDPDAASPSMRSVYKSRVILGQSASGERINIGQQIADVISHAIFCGANLEIGSLDIPVNIPLDECKDMSCADVIRRLLRWVPDTICTIDYSKPTAEISFRRRSQLGSASLNIPSTVSEFSIQPRYDLQIPAVILKFETTNNTNGKTWKEAVQQKYPANATDSTLKALVLTINLEGTKSTYVVQNITAEPIDAESVSWWRSHIPGLGSVSQSDIAVEDVSRLSSLPNELTGGSIASWMLKSAETDVIRCKISYFDGNESVVGREVAVRVTATDATTGTYRKLMSLATAEGIPSNLAKQIYDAVNPLQYDGMAVAVGSEIDRDFFGKTLNITGGQPEWASMNAIVQEVTEHLDSGKIAVKFGPAKHLGATDLAELTRSGRLLFESKNYGERTTAEASGNGVVEQGTHARVDNTSFGTGKYKMIKFVDPSNSEKSIRIDTSDIAVMAVAVKFREEDVCESGVLKKRVSLASEPYSQQTQ
jgi:hypothetical protein